MREVGFFPRTNFLLVPKESTRERWGALSTERHTKGRLWKLQRNATSVILGIEMKDLFGELYEIISEIHGRNNKWKSGLAGR